jgi:hypothetical protein
MDVVKIFNKLAQERGAKGYLIERRECKTGPLKACKTLIIELWWHYRNNNTKVKSFELRGVIPEDKKEEAYSQLYEEVLYYLIDKREEVLKYGI